MRSINAWELKTGNVFTFKGIRYQARTVFESFGNIHVSTIDDVSFEFGYAEHLVLISEGSV